MSIAQIKLRGLELSLESGSKTIRVTLNRLSAQMLGDLLQRAGATAKSAGRDSVTHVISAALIEAAPVVRLDTAAQQLAQKQRDLPQSHWDKTCPKW